MRLDGFSYVLLLLGCGWACIVSVSVDDVIFHPFFSFLPGLKDCGLVWWKVYEGWFGSSVGNEKVQGALEREREGKKREIWTVRGGQHTVALINLFWIQYFTVFHKVHWSCVCSKYRFLIRCYPLRNAERLKHDARKSCLRSGEVQRVDGSRGHTVVGHNTFPSKVEQGKANH